MVKFLIILVLNQFRSELKTNHSCPHVHVSSTLDEWVDIIMHSKSRNREVGITWIIGVGYGGA